ncbi:MAG: hypothetical protein IJ174_07535, partial [Clostridia bacterium]|nr:hypothetical protein [Clostridia bacterium]
AVLLLCVGLSAIKILPPIPGLFNGPSVEESKTIMEAAVAPEIIAGAVAAHQEAGTLYFSGETKGALMDFLGFDPQIPETIGWMYQAVAYSALIAPAGIRVRCTYQALGGDAERIDFKKYLYTDPGNVHTLCEEENHRPTQFTWTEGNAVFLIAASEGASIPETMVTQLLPREAAL